MGITSFLRDRHGQSTIEFAVALPILIIVAVIAVNALLFFSECASFDRLARQTIRARATSPAYGQTLEDSKASIEEKLSGAFDAEYLDVEVDAEGVAGGHTAFTATLVFSPTLFGMGMKSEVLGIALPRLRHETKLVIDIYKPGVLL